MPELEINYLLFTVYCLHVKTLSKGRVHTINAVNRELSSKNIKTGKNYFPQYLIGFDGVENSESKFYLLSTFMLKIS